MWLGDLYFILGGRDCCEEISIFIRELEEACWAVSVCEWITYGSEWITYWASESVTYSFTRDSFWICLVNLRQIQIDRTWKDESSRSWMIAHSFHSESSIDPINCKSKQTVTPSNQLRLHQISADSLPISIVTCLFFHIPSWFVFIRHFYSVSGNFTPRTPPWMYRPLYEP